MKPLFPISLIILSVALFYMYINPTYADVRALQSEVEEYNNILDNAQTLAEKKETLINAYNTFTDNDLLRLEKMIPNAIDNVRLIAEINGIGEKYGITIRATRVQENQSRESSLGDITTSPASGHKTLNITFSFNSTYDKFIQFISDLESNLRIIDFSSISFNVTSGTPALLYQVSVKTHWLP